MSAINMAPADRIKRNDSQHPLQLHNIQASIQTGIQTGILVTSLVHHSMKEEEQQQHQGITKENFFFNVLLASETINEKKKMDEPSVFQKLL